MPKINSIFAIKHNGVINDFSNIPTFQEARKKVLTCKTAKRWHQPAFAVLLITGCRISELVALRKKDITWCDTRGEPVMPNETIDNVKLVYFNLITLKRRGLNKPMRRFPVLNDIRYNELLKIISRYWLACPDDDTLLFEKKSPFAVWKALKVYLDKDYYPHLFRHISATYYAQNGVIGAGLKKRFGWAKETSAEPYVNLNDSYLLEKEYEISARESSVTPNLIVEDKVKEKPVDIEIKKITEKTFKQVQNLHKELVL